MTRVCSSRLGQNGSPGVQPADSAEDLLDLAVLVDQAGDVVAEVLDHRGEERALLDGRVQLEDGDDGARSVGREVKVAGPEGTSDLSGQGHDDVVLGRQLSDRVQILASAVVAHQARVAHPEPPQQGPTAPGVGRTSRGHA